MIQTWGNNFLIMLLNSKVQLYIYIYECDLISNIYECDLIANIYECDLISKFDLFVND